MAESYNNWTWPARYRQTYNQFLLVYILIKKEIELWTFWSLKTEKVKKLNSDVLTKKKRERLCDVMWGLFKMFYTVSCLACPSLIVMEFRKGGS